MTDLASPAFETIEALSNAAGMAAARGEWNLVADYYRQREPMLAHSALRGETLARVQAIDREVADRARLAQAGVESLLRHVTTIRQRLKGLRQWNGGVSSDSGTIERHI